MRMLEENLNSADRDLTVETIADLSWDESVFAEDGIVEGRSIIDPTANPMLGLQWYVDATATGSVATTRINEIWAEVTGRGVSVAVMDSGFQRQHLDLTTRLTSGTGSSGLSASNDHATQVAGVLGADGANSFGIVGVAYNATLTQVDFSYVTSSPTRAQVGQTLALAGQSDILNASWGYRAQFQDNLLDVNWAPVRQAILGNASDGRGGLGTVMVFAAGNDRQYVHGSSSLDGDNTNYHGLTNARQIITVAASDQNGNVANFSTPGASILVAAPGVSIFTTGVVAGRETATDGFETVSGTSFAAPIVSGVVAMMLEANPDLGYRDVQTILAVTAQRTGNPATWMENGATTWNGGGMLVNHDLGFGVVDARAAVRLAQNWTEPAQTAANEVSVTMAAQTSGPAALADGGSVTRTFTLPQNAQSMSVEWIELDFRVTHAHIGDLTVKITSPSGLTSVLIDRPGAGNNTRDNLTFTLTSAQFRGEDPDGNWTVTVMDAQGNGGGTVNQLTLRLFGAVENDDTSYIFTDAVQLRPDGGVLDDATGSNTLNLAAMTLDARVDLPGRSASFGGVAFALTPGTTFARMIGGDGHDHLNAFGAERDVTLAGGYGDDTLIGGLGRDRLDGGHGNDTLIGRRADTLVGGDGDDIIRAPELAAVVVGGAGYDTLDLSQKTGGMFFSVETGIGMDGRDLISVSSIESFVFTSGDDLIVGGSSANVIGLGAGDDTLWGGSGSDTIMGGEGADLIFGAAGDDAIAGGAGNDTVLGGAGNDMIFGEDGDDFIFADEGASSILDGGAGHDTLYGGLGDDYIGGGDGDDVIVGLGGRNQLFGGAGNDILVAGDGPGSFADGGEGSDFLWGGSGRDSLGGGAGDDILVGADGVDALVGGAGNDIMIGGEGTDYIFGGAGDDFIYTDDLVVNHRDFIFINPGDGVDTIADFVAGNGPNSDVLVLARELGFSSFGDLSGSITQAGIYTILSLGSASVYLYNVDAAALSASNVMFA